ncbi:MAG: hypothetical protein NC898_00960 [Candidatus Omnitrophica bacterium]|nr:hypothetical protein [Candidatus Omnitrophota bacterium]
MRVEKTQAIKLVRGVKEYFFSSHHCKEKFIKEEVWRVFLSHPLARSSLFKNYSLNLNTILNDLKGIIKGALVLSNIFLDKIYQINEG